MLLKHGRLQVGCSMRHSSAAELSIDQQETLPHTHRKHSTREAQQRNAENTGLEGIECLSACNVDTATALLCRIIGDLQNTSNSPLHPPSSERRQPGWQQVEIALQL